MRGGRGEVPFPDLLQFLATSKKIGALSLRIGEARAANHLREGREIACEIEGRPQVAPRMAFLRVVACAGGTFELLPSDGSIPGAPGGRRKRAEAAFDYGSLLRQHCKRRGAPAPRRV